MGDTFRARLRHLKQRDRVTAKEIARACDVSVQAVFGWLGGVSMPKTQNIVAVARMFGVSGDYMVHGDADTERSAAIDEIREALPALSNQQVVLLAQIASEFSKTT